MEYNNEIDRLMALYSDLEDQYITESKKNLNTLRKLRKDIGRLRAQNRKYKKMEKAYNELKESVEEEEQAKKSKLFGFIHSNKDKDSEDDSDNDKITEQINIINNSAFFDADWYCRRYPDVRNSGMNPAEHYLLYGWKEKRDPSELFSTNEYLILNNGVLDRNICPLLHFEQHGKYELRQYRIDRGLERTDLEPDKDEILEYERQIDEKNKPQRLEYAAMEIDNNKIVFKTFQLKYTCNPKYICEELLKRNTGYEIVWLYKAGDVEVDEFPENVRLVPADSKQAMKEIATAHIIIDNGSMVFNDKIDKKDGQIGICTWHGSLGFKTIGTSTLRNRNGYHTAMRYKKYHNIMISNSEFENKVYREAYWPDSEILMLGHARNDILINADDLVKARIKRKLSVKYGIDTDTNIVLYAPTFRENMALNTTTDYIPEDVLSSGCYSIDYKLLKETLENKYGGKWVVMTRHHYVNNSNEGLKNMIPDDVINASDYTDIQELMIAADVAITDYSSWILDYMFTKKPAFLFATDADEYKSGRGMYYPLTKAPFMIASNMDELVSNIRNYDQQEYENRIGTFLADKGCIEDGQAASRIVDKIIELMK